MQCCTRYAGKAAYYTGDYKRAQEEYRAAINLDGDLLGAWEGLAECQLAAREGDAAVETFEHLVSMGTSIMILHQENENAMGIWHTGASQGQRQRGK